MRCQMYAWPQSELDGGCEVYVPRRTAVVARDGRILQQVQLHVVVELLRRAGVQRLGEVLHLGHEVVHVLLHRREIQREALRGVRRPVPVRGGGRRPPWLRVATAAEPPRAEHHPGLHEHQQQHRRGDEAHRCHPIHAQYGTTTQAAWSKFNPPPGRLPG